MRHQFLLFVAFACTQLGVAHAGDFGVERLAHRAYESAQKFIPNQDTKVGTAAFTSDKVANGGDDWMLGSGMVLVGAMRSGQLCLVNAMGGLADTVLNGENGFSFGGETSDGEAGQMPLHFREVPTLQREQPDQWRETGAAAAAARFPWDEVARAYIEQLYQQPFSLRELAER